MTDKYKLLIVDDEEPARYLMKQYAEKVDQVEVVDCVDGALKAKAIIEQQNIDILLTDIQMDDLSGLELLSLLKEPPVSILTTAYSEYALEGFELDVVDYLVKPINFQRFLKAIDMAIALINYKAAANTPISAIRNSNDPKHYVKYVFVKTNRKLVRVDLPEILYVESYGEYVKIYTTDDVVLALQSMKSMESILPPNQFVRIHRSHIVNIDQIKEIDGNQVYVAEHRLLVSKRMREPFMQQITDRGII
ncbi:MAG: LytTR family DNA-binding domain-containing protein [Bacteroidota bacterium]